MHDIVYLNGALMPADTATLGIDERGLLFGDGIFETLRIYSGHPYLLDEHLDRLALGAATLRFPMPERAELAAAVRGTIDANRVTDGVVRLTLTRGRGDRLHADALAPGAMPTVLIATRPLSAEAVVSGEGGEAVITAAVHHVPSPFGRRIKSTNYAAAASIARDLADAGVREAILCTRDGMVAEGTVSNVFAVRDGAIVTPPLELGILAGVTRSRVLALARAAGIEVREELFDMAFLASGAECFITSSVREVAPVIAVDGAAIAGGRIGPVTQTLRAAYRAEVCAALDATVLEAP